MQWQGGVHSSAKYREKAVGASFHEQAVEVALEQWTQQYIQTYPVGFNVSSTLQEHSISVLTKCREKLWKQVVPRKTFSPWANSPGRFLYRYILDTYRISRRQNSDLTCFSIVNVQLGNKFPSVPIQKGGPIHETDIRQQTLSQSLKIRRRRIPLRLPWCLYHRHQRWTL